MFVQINLSIASHSQILISRLYACIFDDGTVLNGRVPAHFLLLPLMPSGSILNRVDVRSCLTVAR